MADSTPKLPGTIDAYNPSIVDAFFAQPQLAELPSVLTQGQGNISIVDQLMPDPVYQPGIGDVIAGGAASVIPGWGDEIVGTLSAMADLGGGPGQRQRIEEVRRAQKIFGDQLSGGEKLTFDLASGGLLPIGKGQALRTDIGSNIINSLLKGGAWGATIGAGEGETSSERLSNALQYGAGGAAIGGASAGAIEGGAALAKTKLLQTLLNPFVGKSDTGAWVPKGAKAPGTLPEEVAGLDRALQKRVIKTARELTPKQLEAANTRLTEAQEAGVPMILPEALGTQSSAKLAQYVRMSQGGRDISEEFLDTRAKQTGERLAELFDKVSPQTSGSEAELNLVNTAAKALKRAKKERTARADPLYKQAFEETGTINDRNLIEFVNDSKYIRQAIPKVKAESQYAKRDEFDLEILNEVKKQLAGKVRQARRSGEEYGPIEREEKKLREMLKKISPTYKKALQTYRTDSETMAALNTPALAALESLSRGSPDGIKKATKIIMQLEPKQITALKDVLGDNGRKALKDFARAQIQEVIDTTGDNRQPLFNKWFNSPKGRATLKALVGPRDYRQLKLALEAEQRVVDFAKRYAEGSSTWTRASEEAAQSGYGNVFNVMMHPKQSLEQGVGSLFMPRAEIDQRALAQALMSPENSRALLRESIIPYTRQFSKTKPLIDALINRGVPASNRLTNAYTTSKGD